MADRSGGEEQVPYLEVGTPSVEVDSEEFAEWQRKFDEVIDELPAYGPTLARIKKQYEAVIGFIIDSKRVRTLVQLDRDKKTKENQTIRNFKRRRAELEAKVSKLAAENKRLKKEIDATKDISLMRRKEKERRSSPYHKRFPISSAERRTLKLTPSEAINVDYLEKELARLKHVLDEVQYNTEKRYVPKKQKETLQLQLMNKEKEKEKLERENRYLCHLYLQLSESIKAAKTYYSSIQSSTSSPPLVSFSRYALDMIRNITTNEIVSTLEELGEQDPEEEKEAEFILHCCQKFNELFDSEQYAEAALIAATSPKGVLRTVITLNKFKSVSAASNHTPSPLMMYCFALLDSAHIYPPISAEEGVESVGVAIAEDQIDVIAKWISNDSLPLSKDIGDYLYKNCKCHNKSCCSCQFCLLALVVYRKLKCSFEESLCLARLGKYSSMLSVATANQYNKNDVASLLAAVPSSDLALFLVAPPTGSKPILHLFEALYVLSQSGSHPQRCVELVKSFAVLRSISWQEAVGHETRLRPDLAHSLIPVLSQFPELDWLILQLVTSHMVYTVLSRAIEKTHCTMSQHSNSFTSSSYGPCSDSSRSESRTHTPGSSRPKLTRSERFDADDGADLTSNSSTTITNGSGSSTSMCEDSEEEKK